MATQNESILARLRPTETKWVPKWPIESLFDSIVYATHMLPSSLRWDFDIYNSGSNEQSEHQGA